MSLKYLRHVASGVLVWDNKCSQLKCAHVRNFILLLIVMLRLVISFVVFLNVFVLFDCAPVGMTTYYTTEQCPDGWYELESAKGRLILSVVAPDQSGRTFGEPLSNTQTPEHSHPYQVTVNIASKNIAADDCCDAQGACSGSYVIKNQTANNDSGVPFSQLKLCTLNATDSSIIVPFGTVAFFEPSVTSCPTNWTLFSESDGRFIIGGWEVKGTTASDAPKMAYGSDIVHSHNINSTQNTLQIADVSYAGIDGCCNDNLGASETVPVSGSTDSDSTNIPYIQMLTCISQEKSVVAVDLPTTARLFNTVGCPEDWSSDLDVAGRFLVSLPRGGVSGAQFGGNSLPAHYSGPAGTHSHNFNGVFATDDCEVGLISGCCADGYARDQSYDFSGITNDAQVNLPYLTVPFCTYTGSNE